MLSAKELAAKLSARNHPPAPHTVPKRPVPDAPAAEDDVITPRSILRKAEDTSPESSSAADFKRRVRFISESAAEEAKRIEIALHLSPEGQPCPPGPSPLEPSSSTATAAAGQLDDTRQSDEDDPPSYGKLFGPEMPAKLKQQFETSPKEGKRKKSRPVVPRTAAEGSPEGGTQGRGAGRLTSPLTPKRTSPQAQANLPSAAGHAGPSFRTTLSTGSTPGSGSTLSTGSSRAYLMMASAVGMVRADVALVNSPQGSAGSGHRARTRASPTPSPASRPASKHGKASPPSQPLLLPASPEPAMATASALSDSTKAADASSDSAALVPAKPVVDAAVTRVPGASPTAPTPASPAQLRDSPAAAVTTPATHSASSLSDDDLPEWLWSPLERAAAIKEREAKRREEEAAAAQRQSSLLAPNSAATHCDDDVEESVVSEAGAPLADQLYATQELEDAAAAVSTVARALAQAVHDSMLTAEEEQQEEEEEVEDGGHDGEAADAGEEMEGVLDGMLGDIVRGGEPDALMQAREEESGAIAAAVGGQLQNATEESLQQVQSQQDEEEEDVPCTSGSAFASLVRDDVALERTRLQGKSALTMLEGAAVAVTHSAGSSPGPGSGGGHSVVRAALSSYSSPRPGNALLRPASSIGSASSIASSSASSQSVLLALNSPRMLAVAKDLSEQLAEGAGDSSGCEAQAGDGAAAPLAAPRRSRAQTQSQPAEHSHGASAQSSQQRKGVKELLPSSTRSKRWYGVLPSASYLRSVALSVFNHSTTDKALHLKHCLGRDRVTGEVQVVVALFFDNAGTCSRAQDILGPHVQLVQSVHTLDQAHAHWQLAADALVQRMWKKHDAAGQKCMPDEEWYSNAATGTGWAGGSAAAPTVASVPSRRHEKKSSSSSGIPATAQAAAPVKGEPSLDFPETSFVTQPVKEVKGKRKAATSTLTVCQERNAALDSDMDEEHEAEEVTAGWGGAGGRRKRSRREKEEEEGEASPSVPSLLPAASASSSGGLLALRSAKKVKVEYTNTEVSPRQVPGDAEGVQAAAAAADADETLSMDAPPPGGLWAVLGRPVRERKAPFTFSNLGQMPNRATNTVTTAQLREQQQQHKVTTGVER